MTNLIDQPLEFPAVPLSAAAARLIADARAVERTIDCFDFVPSNYENAWSALSLLSESEGAASLRFCEWGSGMGVVTGLAALLGFPATGIELDPQLAAWSMQFLEERSPAARIVTGSYLELDVPAELVYVYAWPGQTALVEQKFLESSIAGARLLFCAGQDILLVRSKE